MPHHASGIDQMVEIYHLSGIFQIVETLISALHFYFAAHSVFARMTTALRSLWTCTP